MSRHRLTPTKKKLVISIKVDWAAIKYIHYLHGDGPRLIATSIELLYIIGFGMGSMIGALFINRPNLFFFLFDSSSLFKHLLSAFFFFFGIIIIWMCVVVVDFFFLMKIFFIYNDLPLPVNRFFTHRTMYVALVAPKPKKIWNMKGTSIRQCGCVVVYRIL